MNQFWPNEGFAHPQDSNYRSKVGRMVDRHQAGGLTGASMISFVLLLLLLSATHAYGEAIRNLHQGTAATGQGDAFAAQADDPSAMFYNPAGMTQLDRIQFYASTLLLIGGYYDFTSPSGQPFRGNLDGTIVVPPPSTFYLTGKNRLAR